MLRICLLLTLLWTSNIWADSCDEFKDTRIGYVNIRKLMQNAPQIEQIRKQLSQEFDAERQQIVSLRNKIATLINSYDETAGKTDSQALTRLQEDIDKYQATLAKVQQRMQSNYNLRRNEEIAKLQSLIVNMVAKVAKERKLVNVQNEAAVIYINTCVDITPAVFGYLSEASEQSSEKATNKLAEKAIKPPQKIADKQANVGNTPVPNGLHLNHDSKPAQTGEKPKENDEDNQEAENDK